MQAPCSIQIITRDHRHAVMPEVVEVPERDMEEQPLAILFAREP